MGPVPPAQLSPLHGKQCRREEAELRERPQRPAPPQQPPAADGNRTLGLRSTGRDPLPTEQPAHAPSLAAVGRKGPAELGGTLLPTRLPILVYVIFNRESISVFRLIWAGGGAVCRGLARSGPPGVFLRPLCKEKPETSSSPDSCAHAAPQTSKKGKKPPK